MQPAHSPARFGERLNIACDLHPECPELNKGRLVWIKDQFNRDNLQTISLETVRKWVSGEVWPRRSKLDRLAQILLVDVVWLETGFAIEPSANVEDGPSTKTGDILQKEPVVEIQIRTDKTVSISGIPLDLTASEARRIANVIIAHAISD